jgi:3-(3-hydroxy-phenyl)propionate hydroxylase
VSTMSRDNTPTRRTTATIKRYSPAPGGMHRYEWRINPGEDIAEMTKPEGYFPIISWLSHKASGDPTPIDASFLDVKRTWEYTFHERHAAQWRVGRIFLLGDAAHLMPAFAGAGMTAAIRDCANLVWKVKAVLDGRADQSILDSYQLERSPHVAITTAYSQRLGRIIQVKNPIKAALRNAYYRTIKHIPGLREYTTSLKGKPVPGFTEGFVSSVRKPGSPVGRTFPNYDVGTENGRMLLDDYVGYNFAIFGLDVDPRTLMDERTVDQWVRYGARFVTIRTATLIVDADEVGDPVGRLWEWFGRMNGAKLAIVRPDHIVYAVDSDGGSLGPL